MTAYLTDDQLQQRLSTSLTAVAESLDAHPRSTTDVTAPVVALPSTRRGGRRAALVGAGVVALCAPVGAVAWMGATPDWTRAPDPPRAIETLRVGDEEIWLAHGERPTEDVQVLSEAPGPEWGGFTMGRHADAPVSDLDWGAILLEEEQQLVFYTGADATVDSLRVVVDGVAREITSHRVGNGSYSIFAVDTAADQLVVTPRRAGTPVTEARLRMEVPKP